MANEQRRLSDLPQASAVQGSDRIVFLQNSASTPMARTINVTNFANSISISTLRNSGQTVALSNSGTLTFTNGGKLGANIEGDAIGFELSGPATLDYVGISYGQDPVNGNSSYLSLYKENYGSNSSHGFTIQMWKGNSAGNFAQWTFNSNNTLSIPGPIAGATETQTYVSTTIELDLNKTVNKLTPHAAAGAPHYHLSSGTEGQIMYLVPNDNGPTNGSESTTMSFSAARWVGSGYVSSYAPANGWKPFGNGSAVVTLLFSDGYWNLPHTVFG
jgi:hypothetical protein